MSSTPATPHPIWDALLSPARSVEVRAWLRQPGHHEKARQWRGPRGETMLHWASMADLGLMMDLLAAGLDANAIDGIGATPVDWLTDRLWMTHKEGVGNLTAMNRRKLRMQTDDLLSALWRAGGRPARQDLDVRTLAMETGLWQVLATWRDTEGPWAWEDWTCGTALHAWPLAPSEQGRRDFLAAWLASGRSVDAPDGQGRTALMAAVSARLGNPPALAAQDLDLAVAELLAAGADPQAQDRSGASALSLTLTHATNLDVAESLAQRLDQAVPAQEGLDVRAPGR